MDFENRPDIGIFHGFHHVRFWVSNSKQAASFFTSRFGFHRQAFQGLQTGCKTQSSHVIKNGTATLVFTSWLTPDSSNQIAQHVSKHSDAVKDVAFHVDDVRGIYQKATQRGAVGIKAPQELKDQNGSVIIASLQTYGETIHTLVEIVDYKGPFLPGFQAPQNDDPLNTVLPSVNIDFIDHVVGNQPENQMNPTAEWYMRMLDFHEFWSVDETVLHTEYSALRSVVMADYDENVKLPINQPAVGLKKSQIQEYVDYYGGPGVQHIALNTSDILSAISAMRARGIQFLEVPKNYYKNLKARLEGSYVQIEEDLNKIQELNILVDFDDQGYLLQIFTQPVEDRPTVFFEIIQRHNNNGFGVGNFKALFEAIEQEQEKRGNLQIIKAFN